MDARQIDGIAKTLSSGASRRGILSVLVGGLAAALGRWHGGAGAASQEEPNLIEVDDEFVDDFWTETCGFEVVQRVEGAFKQVFVRDQLQLETYRLTHTLTGPGESLTWRDRGSNTDIVFNPDGTITVTAAGPILRLTVPGEGAVVADIGRHRVIVTFDAEGNIVGEEVLWKAGPSPDDADAADRAAVCTWLAG
jgi:hypothetical protein